MYLLHHVVSVGKQIAPRLKTLQNRVTSKTIDPSSLHHGLGLRYEKMKRHRVMWYHVSPILIQK